MLAFTDALDTIRASEERKNFREFVMQQDQDIATTASAQAVPLCGKSWIAYVGVLLQFAVLTALLAGFILWQPHQWPLAATVYVLLLLWPIYRWWLIRSVRLYFDDIGVWKYSGVLPWKRGLTGVKWRDLDEAVFVNSFWSWLSRSYTVQVRHRFTKANEIDEIHMAGGKQAVVTINQQHQQRIRDGLPL